jgi:ribosomal protein L29
LFLQQSLASHIKFNKKGQKQIKEALKELIKESFLLSKQSTNEQHVSINPRKIKEIKELLKI